MRKIIKPTGYVRDLCNLKQGSTIFGKGCYAETYLICDSLDENAPAFAVFNGHISEEQLKRISEILNTDELESAQ